jgi:hypothetical protein
MFNRFALLLVGLGFTSSFVACKAADDAEDSDTVVDDDGETDDDSGDSGAASDDDADDDDAIDDDADDDTPDDDSDDDVAEPTDDDDALTGDAGSEDDDSDDDTSVVDAGGADDDVASDSGTGGESPGADASTDGADAGSDPAEEVLIVDPAPNATEPGEYDCEGCPGSEVVDYEIVVDGDSTLTFTGAVEGALGDGEFYIEGSDGQSIAGPIPTDPTSGAYELTVPLFCGTQLVKFVWSNEVGSYVLVVRVVRENCIDADIQATLTWDDLGLDYELHLVKEGGQINDPATDCTWDTCISSSPDWGVAGDAADDPVKDVDNTSTFGPENIYLSGPEDGTYTVMVEHWGSGSPESGGEVTLNVGGKTYVSSIENFVSHHVWTVGTIEWPSGDVVLDGSVFDCTAEWSGGCNAMLPQQSTLPGQTRP